MLKTISYDEAFAASMEYFEEDELASNTFLSKYALKDNDGNLYEKTPTDMHWRMANEFARVEKKKFKDPLSALQIFNLFDHFKYLIPQGSPMYGIGNIFQFITLSNCYLVDPPLDSYNSILKVDHQLVSISKRRGGVGVDMDNLRPAGAKTANAARTSTGVVSFCQRYSNSIREVGQEGRRGALMLTLSVHHPQVMDFATMKNDETQITGANISIKITREFLDALLAGKDYEQRWPVDARDKGQEPKISRMVSAAEVWKTIIHSAWLRAEPGLLMWDNVTENTPADCYENYRSKGTNPCSEINLSPLDSCRLLALNLLSYVTHPFTSKAKFDYDLFTQHAKIAQRLMDDMVDLETEKIDQILAKIDTDPEPESEKQAERDLWKRIRKYNVEGRRTGTGITAMGDCLAALGIKYGSEESIKKVGKIYQTLKHAVYESSIDMAEELGPFKEWDWEKEKNNPFIKRIQSERPDLIKRMIKHGRRNISLTTTAPTGTVSIMTQTTSGVEPLFMHKYDRKKKVNPSDVNAKVDYVDESGDKWQTFTVWHPTVKKWMAITGETDLKNSPWCCAEEIDWVNRVRMQAEAQKHVCHAISSTVNLPADATEQDVARVYEAAFTSGCKGITVYRKGSRKGVLVESNSSNSKKIEKTDAPRRPKELPCDIYHMKVSKKLDKPRTFDYMVLVGKLDGVPYEVFAVENGKYDKDLKTGKIVKNGKGIYDLHFDGSEIIVHNITKETTENEDALTRMISTSLRHGADVRFVAEQLLKVEGELLGFSKCIARALKKYIKDGAKAGSCACGGELIYQEGCATCKSCGSSKCS